MKKLKALTFVCLLISALFIFTFSACALESAEISFTVPENYTQSEKEIENLTFYISEEGSVIKLTVIPQIAEEKLYGSDYFTGYAEEDYYDYPKEDIDGLNFDSEAFYGYNITWVKEKSSEINGVIFIESIYGLVNLSDGSKYTAVEYLTCSPENVYTLTLFNKGEELASELMSVINSVKFSDKFLQGYNKATEEYKKETEQYQEDTYGEDYDYEYSEDYGYDYEYSEDIFDLFDIDSDGEGVIVAVIIGVCVGAFLGLSIVNVIILICMLRYNSKQKKHKAEIAEFYRQIISLEAEKDFAPQEITENKKEIKPEWEE